MRGRLTVGQRPLKPFIKVRILAPQIAIISSKDMKKQPKKPVINEWLELTLCDMLDDILRLMRGGKSKTAIMKVVKKYSTEIYNAHNQIR